MRVGKLKLTFHCFFLCVCLCTCVISGSAKQYRWLFFGKSAGIPVFFLCNVKSGSLYFLHKLLNETAYLRSMKNPGVGITAFFVCPTVGNRPTSER